MLGVKSYLLGTAILLSGLIVAGCQTAGPHSGSPVADSQAVACEKCKVTWVQAPEKGPKGRIMGYTTKASHECPDCRAAAETYFRTGKMEHTCKHCGDGLQVCQMHRS